MRPALTGFGSHHAPRRGKAALDQAPVPRAQGETVRIEVLADALDCALRPCFVARYADWELPLDRLAVLRPERLLFRRRQRLPELSI
ncbi:MAG: hypothetical protein HYY85_07250 [Deltaproteobacteria bacterium]|nr:hypothetical protein [Deltaproteobacteria bacterium]